ncbi:hypothetical protein [Geosporobacter ferrireducens]|uniref:hypothetical protein n=1 Tax=Geosporobacter ferrireducens TaxID=1424294 RepID=UPI00139E9430|nr:hypothetical protein [Geosporobacter ferrireducens]MTI57480.1 hypothetical protein [Geosporobacter ferrireducens]
MILIQNINPTKLHDELISAGVIPIFLENDKKDDEFIAENTWIAFSEDTDIDLVQQIIDAHDPTPKPEPPTEIELLQQENLELKLALAELAGKSEDDKQDLQLALAELAEAFIGGAE